MPEAPEVEALALFLRERLIGHEVVGTELVEGRAWKTRARPLDQLVGRRVSAVVRYGKHIDLNLDGAHLSLGFGRAGWATWSDADADADANADAVVDADADADADADQAAGAAASPVAAVIARIVFDDGALGITDAGDWLSVQLHLVDDPAEVPAVAKLGPDAIDPAFSREMLQKALGGRRKQLKALLQEQETLAGIGNAYSDEILFAARLSPVAHASSLGPDEVTRLFEALHATLAAAVAARRGVPIAEQKAAKVAAMQVHGRAGEPCPGCGGVIEDIPGTKGGGQWCPSCQGGRGAGSA